MKSNIKLIPVIALMAIVSLACSPVKVYTEKSDFVEAKQYQTFAILSEVKGKPAFNSPIVEERLQQHLVEGMEQRGFSYNADQPDLIIRYNTDVTPNQRIIYPNPYDMWWPMWGPPTTRTQKYDQGEVIIDFIDPQADRVIMRATAVGTVNNPDEKQKKVKAAVDKILKEFSTKLVNVNS
ncbi:DUF4136 domain-containing protein [Litoribacter ruber]|nr:MULTISPECIES: DUF4136 domain-containing protein [Litoribacter]